jgi:hypothetical protein
MTAKDVVWLIWSWFKDHWEGGYSVSSFSSNFGDDVQPQEIHALKVANGSDCCLLEGFRPREAQVRQPHGSRQPRSAIFCLTSMKSVTVVVIA